MKAKEYYDNYKDVFFGEETRNKSVAELTLKIRELLLSFIKEGEKLLADRHVKTESGARSVFMELNQKWNALSSLFVKNNKISPIKKDSILRVWNGMVKDLNKRKEEQASEEKHEDEEKSEIFSTDD